MHESQCAPHDWSVLTRLFCMINRTKSSVSRCWWCLPADMVKVRLQCQREPPDSRRRYRGPLHCLLRIARDEGLLGLYKGSSALALRDGPSFATYFLTYSSMCELLRSADGRQTSTCAHTTHLLTLMFQENIPNTR